MHPSHLCSGKQGPFYLLQLRDCCLYYFCLPIPVAPWRAFPPKATPNALKRHFLLASCRCSSCRRTLSQEVKSHFYLSLFVLRLSADAFRRLRGSLVLALPHPQSSTRRQQRQKLVLSYLVMVSASRELDLLLVVWKFPLVQWKSGGILPSSTFYLNGFGAETIDLDLTFTVLGRHTTNF